jgi:hypothetical protein
MVLNACINKQPEFSNGDICTIPLKENTTIKRVYKDNGRLELVPDNPLYARKVFTNGDVRILAFSNAVEWQVCPANPTESRRTSQGSKKIFSQQRQEVLASIYIIAFSFLQLQSVATLHELQG